MPDWKFHRQLITVAEQQFKLALAVRARCSSAAPKNAFDYLQSFSFGKHIAASAELSLTPEQELFAAAALEHSTTYVIAVQIDTALESVFKKDRFAHSDHRVKNAACIACLIRNAFAHDPLNPVWLISRKCHKQVYELENIIQLNTTGLNNQEVKPMDYGGPLALLRFSQYVKEQLLCD